MKKIFLRTALVGTLILFAGCGSSASNSDSSASPSYDSGSDPSYDSGSDSSYDSGSDSGSDSSYGYTAEIANNFVSSCSSSGGTYSQCSCMYNYIKDNMTYAEFARIDAEMTDGSPASDYPVLVNALDQCA